MTTADRGCLYKVKAMRTTPASVETLEKAVFSEAGNNNRPTQQPLHIVIVRRACQMADHSL